MALKSLLVVVVVGMSVYPWGGMPGCGGVK